MFSFFKRFKGSKEAENAPDESQDAPNALVDDLTRQALAAPPADAAPPFTTPFAPETQPDSPLRTPAQPASQPEAVFDDSSLETVEIVPPPVQDASAKRSWLTRLKTGLSKTSSSLTGIFVGTKIDEDLYEELETALLMSDAGVDATEFLLEALREKVRTERLTEPQQVKAALRALLVDLLKPLEKSLMLGRAKPLVMMIAGVNGDFSSGFSRSSTARARPPASASSPSICRVSTSPCCWPPATRSARPRASNWLSGVSATT